MDPGRYNNTLLIQLLLLVISVGLLSTGDGKEVTLVACQGPAKCIPSHIVQLSEHYFAQVIL